MKVLIRYLSCLDSSFFVCAVVEIPFYPQPTSLIIMQEMPLLVVSTSCSERLISVGPLVDYLLHSQSFPCFSCPGRIHDLLKREKMLCWGYSSFGQPGIGSNLQVIVPEPQVYGFIHDRNVKEVACGGNHSVFLLEDGEVYTCGLNTKGQLGHDCEGSKPGKFAFYTCFKLYWAWLAGKTMEAALCWLLWSWSS